MQTTCESPLPGPFAAAADPAATALWAARARIEDARGVVLELQVSPRWVRGPTVFCPMARLTAPASSCPLQDSARALQSQLTAASPAPPATLAALRASVLRLRVALAERLGLRSFDEQSGGGAEPDASPPPPGSVDDDAVLLVVSLPKGKRLLARAVPMLLPVDRVSAVTAGLRQLPHFAASENVGAVSRPSPACAACRPRPPRPSPAFPPQAAEEADADLCAALARWAASVLPSPVTEAAAPVATVPGDYGGVAIATAAHATLPLGLCAAWLAELHSSVSGALVRVLLEVRPRMGGEEVAGAPDASAALLPRLLVVWCLSACMSEAHLVRVPAPTLPSLSPPTAPQHANSKGVISAVIGRGETESQAAAGRLATALAAADASGAAPDAADISLASAQVAWQAATEALGRAFVQAGEGQ